MFDFLKKKEQFGADEIVRLIGNALEEGLVANEDAQTIRGRISSAISGGYDFADTLHNIYLDFGYPESLGFEQFWNMYRRFGIAKNVIELPVDVTWMRDPVIESSDQFVAEFDKLNTAVKVWTRCKGLDTRQRVGRYAGMFMRVRDNQKPDQPLEGRLPGLGALVQMVPLYEGQLKVLETDNEPTSDTYGLPKMYQFNGGSDGSRNENTADSFSIHPNRVVVAAEGADNGGIYGIPALEACYNSLMDLRKIIGGGGEGFYKNAAQNIVFSLKDGASAKANKSLLDKFNDTYDEFSRNRSRRAMWTPGMEAKTLESSLTNPKEFFQNALNDVAACSKMAATIIIGQQTGRLASGEDSRSFLSMGNSRRTGFANDMSRDVIDWCIDKGILPSAEYELAWDDLLALSKNEQLDNAFKMADINSKQFASGGDIPFEGEEIRESAGFDPEEDIEPGSEDLDDIDDDGPED